MKDDMILAVKMSDFLAEQFPLVSFIISSSKTDGKVIISWQDSIDADSVLDKISAIDHEERNLILSKISIRRHFSYGGIIKVKECLKNNYGINDDVEIYDVDGDELFYSLKVKIPELTLECSRYGDEKLQSNVDFMVSKITEVMRIIKLED